MTQLLQVLDKWTDMLDEGGSVDVIYLDLAKAFDTDCCPTSKAAKKTIKLWSRRKGIRVD